MTPEQFAEAMSGYFNTKDAVAREVIHVVMDVPRPAATAA